MRTVMITEQRLYKEFNYYKKKSRLALRKNKIEEALSAMKLSCVLAKNYYLCYEDDDLEETIKEISDVLIPYKRIRGVNGRYLFYDTHTTDNVALTQQYLGALLSWDVPFLYITTKTVERSDTKMIKRMLETSDKVAVFEIPSALSETDKVKLIVEKVRDYLPARALIQTTADDVSGIAAWLALTDIERFYIDLSDHSFWLGAKGFEYYITFRNRGYNTCVQKRKIEKDKILIQPFYPIAVSEKFKGIPAAHHHSVKIFSGGRMDKIYGRNDKYFHIVKRILDENKNAEFYFSGGGAFGKLGQMSYIDKQIRSLDLGVRFHVLGFRNDIVALMQNMDLYLGTYPMGGGLMTQIAASNGVPVVQYATKGLSDHTDEFLIACDDAEKVLYIEDEDGLCKEIRRLVSDSEYRKKRGGALRKQVLHTDDFNEQLKQLLERKRFEYPIESYMVDCTLQRQNQIDVENNCVHAYHRILVKSEYVKKRQPVKFLYSVFLFFINTDKKWILNKLKSR